MGGSAAPQNHCAAPLGLPIMCLIARRVNEILIGTEIIATWVHALEKNSFCSVCLTAQQLGSRLVVVAQVCLTLVTSVQLGTYLSGKFWSTFTCVSSRGNKNC